VKNIESVGRAHCGRQTFPSVHPHRVPTDARSQRRGPSQEKPRTLMDPPDVLRCRTFKIDAGPSTVSSPVLLADAQVCRLAAERTDPAGLDADLGTARCFPDRFSPSHSRRVLARPREKSRVTPAAVRMPEPVPALLLVTFPPPYRQLRAVLSDFAKASPTRQESARSEDEFAQP